MGNSGSARLISDRKRLELISDLAFIKIRLCCGEIIVEANFTREFAELVVRFLEIEWVIVFLQ